MTEYAERGLSEAEARVRQARGQANALPPATARTYRQILRDNAFTYVNAVIVVLAVSLLALGQWSDALVSVGVIAVNIVVGLVQEVRAKRLLDRIALLTRPHPTVVRDGIERAVEAGEVVAGDLVVCRRGDQIVVDGRIVDGQVDVDESLLTGESDPVARGPGAALLSGSFCVRGSARYEATAVGDAAYANRLTTDAKVPRRVRTPLQRQIELVVRVMLFLAASFGIILVISAIVEGLPLVEIVRRAVVVIGLVPNGLFVAIAAAYAIGAVRMAGKGVLVQQTNAVESMSNVDVLCLDKTGTLTSGRLGVDEVRALAGDERTVRDLLGRIAASASGAGRTVEAIGRACPGARGQVRDEVAFASEQRWSGIAFADDPGRLFVVGAPDALRDRCADPRTVDAAVDELASRGARVLLVGSSAGERFARASAGPALPERIEPLAVVALRDELRPDAHDTLAAFAANGIALKVISGDHPETVRAVATRSGLGATTVISGDALADADDERLARLASENALFARVAPREKERLVAALRARGRYVAMVGDGVNDVPALKRADLAIAINDGSEAARAVADLVLLENSFAALPIAFREGQRVLGGMQDVLRLFLTRVAYVALLIITTALVDVGFPYTPKQTAILTFLTVGAPAIVLAAVARPSPRIRERLAGALVRFVAPAAWSLALVGLLTYVGYAAILGSVERAQTTLTVLTVLSGIGLILFVAPPTWRWTAVERGVAGWPSAALVVAMLAGFAWILVDPARRAFFDLGPVAAEDVALAAALTMAWLVVLRWIWSRSVFERAFGLAPAIAARG